MRCFTAIDIGEALRDRLSKVAADIGKLDVDSKPVERENLHVTLVFLGELGEKEVGLKTSALKSLRFAPFQVELRGVGFFPSASRINTVWAGCGSGSERLSELQAAIAQSLGTKDERGYTPHVALARVKSPRNLELLRKFASRYTNEVWGTFKVDKVTLKESTLTPAGPIYRDIAAVALNAGRL